MLHSSLQDCEMLASYIESSNHFYQELLGYKPEQTKLKFLSETKWLQFTNERGLNPHSSGIYLPRNQIAIIQRENPLSLFHEYLGHGLYCEQSLSGKKLVELEKRLLEEENQEFQGRYFVLEDLQKFRKQNKMFQKLNEFKKQNLTQYELFAIWTEYLLSNEFNLKEEFEKKYDSLQNRERESIDSIINSSENYGSLATFYSQGMAKRTTTERVKKLLEDVYGNKLQDVKFALLYGSRKEFSDIDVFMVGNEVPRIRNDWIDVISYSPLEFEEKRKLFDVEITDPLFSGEFVFGNEDYFEQQKQKLREQPITGEAIKYNLQEAETQKKSSYNFSEDSEWRQIGLSYALTSRLMAENLKQGRRLFTKENLLLYSHGEKQIQLKGGTRK